MSGMALYDIWDTSMPWFMSHMIHVSHTKTEWCYTHWCVESHTSRHHVAHMNASCRTREWSCHLYRRDMSRIPMCHAFQCTRHSNAHVIPLHTSKQCTRPNVSRLSMCLSYQCTRQSNVSRIPMHMSYQSVSHINAHVLMDASCWPFRDIRAMGYKRSFRNSTHIRLVSLTHTHIRLVSLTHTHIRLVSLSHTHIRLVCHTHTYKACLTHRCPWRKQLLPCPASRRGQLICTLTYTSPPGICVHCVCVCVRVYV